MNASAIFKCLAFPLSSKGSQVVVSQGAVTSPVDAPIDIVTQLCLLRLLDPFNTKTFKTKITPDELVNRLN